MTLLARAVRGARGMATTLPPVRRMVSVEIPEASFALGVPARVHSRIDLDDSGQKLRFASTYLPTMRQLADEYRRQGLWARP